jgi:DNA-binding Xre family transcriptional regulator
MKKINLEKIVKDTRTANTKEIRKRIRERGIVIKKFAEEIGVTVTAVHLVIMGRGASAKIRKALCEVLDADMDELFPYKYKKGGGKEVK